MFLVQVQPVRVSDAEMARAVHAIQMAAYAQEAELLGVKAFPPLERTLQDVRLSAEQFLGAWASGALVGALAYESSSEGPGMLISSLVVSPAWQRRRVGTSLVSAAIAQFGKAPVSVSTAAKNHSALGLYTKLGFVEHSRSLLGPEKLEVITLLRK